MRPRALVLAALGVLGTLRGAVGAPAPAPVPSVAPIHYLEDGRVRRARPDGSGSEELAWAYGRAAHLCLAASTGQLAFVDPDKSVICTVAGGAVTHRIPLPKEDRGRVERLTWSPLGDLLVLGMDGGGPFAARSVHLVDPAAESIVPLGKKGAGDFDPSWTADGRGVLLVTVTRTWEEHPSEDAIVLGWDGAIERVDVRTRERRRVVAPAPRLSSPAGSPDGALVAYASITDVYVAAMAEGGKPRSLLKANVAHGPTWLPDGKRLLVTVPQPMDPAEMDAVLTLDVVTLDLDGRRRSSFAVRNLEDLSLAPDGSALAFLVGYERLERATLDGRDRKVLATRAPARAGAASISLLEEVVWSARR